MMKLKSATVLFLLFLTGPVLAEQSPSVNALLDRVLENATRNDELMKGYGGFQEVISKKLEENGKVKEEETRLYRTIWIEGTPYEELVQVNGKELTPDQTKEEAKRKKKFIESLRKKKEESKEKEEFTWDELRGKYDFELLPQDEQAHYVLSFQPKKGKLPERSRMEKVLNHISGKLWADEHYNIVRIIGRLTEPVRFGLGLVAKIDSFEMDYRLKRFKEVSLPASLSFQYEARLALLKKARQQVAMRFYDFFSKANAPRAENHPPSSR